MLSAQKKIIIIFSIDILVILLFIFLLILPLLSKIESLSVKYQANQSKLLRLSNQETLLNNLKNQFAEDQEDLDKISGAFLEKNEALGFITDIEKIADATKNKIQIQTYQEPSRSLGIEQESTAETEQSYAFKIDLSGSYSSLIHFIANLEDTPYPPYRLIKLEDITVNKNISSSGGTQQTAEQDEISAKITVKVYVK